MTRTWTLWPGRARVPDAAAPDVRGRSYAIRTTVVLERPEDGGVLLAHGDGYAGYAVRVDAGRLVHDYAQDGVRSTAVGRTPVPLGRPVDLEVRVRRTGESAAVTLLVDGEPCGEGTIPVLASARVGYTGVDVGCDRGRTVGDYDAPARFTGHFDRIEVVAEDDQEIDLVTAWTIDASTG